MKEKPPGSNRGDPIDDWRQELGYAHPVPWCAVFASVKSREGDVEEPEVWSARARDFVVKGRSRKVADVVYDRYTPRPGDYRVKTRRGGNHVDIFLSWDQEKQRGYVIGGNVGDRVQVRLLTLQRMMVDGTTHITKVDGVHRYRDAIPGDWGSQATEASAEDSES